MNQELQEALLSLIKKIDMGINWSADQIPSAILEMLHYAIMKNVIGLIVWGTVLYVGIRMIMTIKKKFGNNETRYQEEIYGYDVCHGITCAILTVAGFIGALDSLYYVVKTTLFPQAWIMGMLLDMVK